MIRWSAGPIPSALLALGLLAAPAAAEPATPERNPAARPGAFCPPGGCRPAPAARGSTAAFGAAVITTLWMARRREHEER